MVAQSGMTKAFALPFSLTNDYCVEFIFFARGTQRIDK